MEEQIFKLAIYLNGSHFIDGEFKLKIYTYIIDKESDKTITMLDGKRSIRKNRKDVDVVKTDFKNDTFNCISFYCFCKEENIEKMSKELVKAIKARFKENEDLYKSTKKALKEELKVIHVV